MGARTPDLDREHTVAHGAMSAGYSGVTGDGLAGETARVSSAYDMTSVFGLEVLFLNEVDGMLTTQPMRCDIAHTGHSIVVEVKNRCADQIFSTYRLKARYAPRRR